MFKIRNIETREDFMSDGRVQRFVARSLAEQIRDKLKQETGQRYRILRF